MIEKELINCLCDLIKGTVKDGIWFNTEVSNDYTQIIQTFLFFNHEIKVFFDVVEILKRKNSAKDFLNYIKVNIQKAFVENWGKLNDSKTN